MGKWSIFGGNFPEGAGGCTDRQNGWLYWNSNLGEAMKIVQMADAVRFPRMTTAELRETFLAGWVFSGQD